MLIKKIFIASACGLLLTACSGKSAVTYEAEIIRTSHGVPHITADDFSSLGYGEGYAAAQDHLCNIARAVVIARGESAKYFGAGDKNQNLHRDAVVLAGLSETSLDGVFNAFVPEVQQMLLGYVEGFNRYVDEVLPAGGTSWCEGEPWVRKVSRDDLLANFIVLIRTTHRMSEGLVAAQPPMTDVAIHVDNERLIAALDEVKLGELGSNAWAFGKDKTADGRGLLLANPHYPWYGHYRFWEKHLTIPGKFDMYGVSLLGLPGVAIGTNQHVAWSHTVSDSSRLVFYKLTLNPKNATQYWFDGEWQDMQSTTLDVQVKDGSPVTVTLWNSRHGPIIALPGMPWDASSAYAVLDANQNNFLTMNQWLSMANAGSMDELVAAHEQWNAMPWVNTIAVDDQGQAAYFDNSTVAAINDNVWLTWRKLIDQSPKLAALYEDKNVVILDGSVSATLPEVQEDVPVKGTTNFAQRPLIRSTNYVLNANDSYWLSDPTHPTTGYSPLYGPVETVRSLRTRMNMLMLDSQSPYSILGEDGIITADEIQQGLFAGEGLTHALLIKPLLAACHEAGTVEVDSVSVDLTSACEALSLFNGHYTVDSRAAALFREWITAYDYSDSLRGNKLFSVPFSTDNPVTTPNTLSDKVLAVQNLGRAVLRLQAAGVALDASLGEVQKIHRPGISLPLPGGNRYEGVANLMITEQVDHPTFTGSNVRINGSELLTSSGYNAMHGSSFVMIAGFDDRGPNSRAILTYSESGDPSSPYSTDQTRMFAKGEMRAVLFHRNDIDANAVSRLVVTQ